MKPTHPVYWESGLAHLLLELGLLLPYGQAPAAWAALLEERRN